MRKIWLIPAFLIGMALSMLVLGSMEESKVKTSPIGIYSNVEVRHNGELVYTGTNVLTRLGANLTAEYLAYDASRQAVDFIAVGNGSAPTVSDTSLDSEIAEGGLSRAAGTVGNSNGNISVSNEFTWTGNSIVVNTTGLFNHTSENTGYFAGDEFTDRTLQNGDKLNITWYYWAA